MLPYSAVNRPTVNDRIQQVFADQVFSSVRTATGGALDTTTRAGLISTQLLGFALCHYVLRPPPVADLPAETLIAATTPVL